MSGANAMRWVALLAATASSVGCQLFGGTYRGAIYYESQHWGIGMRGSPEAAMPLQVDVGYDRDIVAFVPSDAAGGEGGSLVAYNRTVAAEVLAEQGIPLRYDGIIVEAGMFAGDAAVALVGGDGGADASGATDAEVAKRIANAFGSEKGIEGDVDSWIESLSKRDAGRKLFGQVAEKLPPDFRKLYDSELKALEAEATKGVADEDAKKLVDAQPLKELAFRRAATNWLTTNDELLRATREGELKRSLAAVLREDVKGTSGGGS